MLTQWGDRLLLWCTTDKKDTTVFTFAFPTMFPSWKEALDETMAVPLASSSISGRARAIPNAEIQPPFTWDDSVKSHIYFREDRSAEGPAMTAEVYSPRYPVFSDVSIPMPHATFHSLFTTDSIRPWQTQIVAIGLSVVKFEMETDEISAATIIDVRSPRTTTQRPRKIAKLTNATALFYIDPWRGVVYFRPRVITATSGAPIYSGQMRMLEFLDD